MTGKEAKEFEIELKGAWKGEYQSGFYNPCHGNLENAAAPGNLPEPE
jgi:hypothetical protein